MIEEALILINDEIPLFNLSRMAYTFTLKYNSEPEIKKSKLRFLKY